MAMGCLDEKMAFMVLFHLHTKADNDRPVIQIIHRQFHHGDSMEALTLGHNTQLFSES